MTDDITTALETVRKALWVASDRSVRGIVLVPRVVTDAPAALSTIEAELTRLWEVAAWANEELPRLRAQEAADRRSVNRLCAERDEARDYGERLYAHVQRLEAWRQHLEAALQDIGNDADAYHPLAVKARDALSPKETDDGC